MFLMSRRSVVIPGGDRDAVRLERGFVGEAPDWLRESAYFRALVADGKIVLPERRKAKGKNRKTDE